MAAQLVVVGGGRMGEALAGGVLRREGTEAASLVIVERLASRRDELNAGLVARHPGLTVSAEVPAAAGAVVAVKPGEVEAACAELVAAGVDRVLSIAAGVTLGKLEGWLGAGVAVLRAMPNTPALIGAGASAVAPGSATSPADLAWASEILAAVGMVTTVPESLLDAVTGLSGSGPAYVFLMAEALVDAGVLVGLTRSVALDLVVATLLGSARLLAESGEGPAELRAGVTSPGGTTAAGLRALEAAGLRSAVLDAVVAAASRAAQLGA